jgi:hypothetical protein
LLALASAASSSVKPVALKRPQLGQAWAAVVVPGLEVRPEDLGLHGVLRRRRTRTGQPSGYDILTRAAILASV